jgi:hypothetical protein
MRYKLIAEGTRVFQRVECYSDNEDSHCVYAPGRTGSHHAKALQFHGFW